MRKDPQSKEGGTGTIESIYFVISEDAHDTERGKRKPIQRKVDERADRQTRESLAPEPSLGREFFFFFSLRRIMDKGISFINT